MSGPLAKAKLATVVNSGRNRQIGRVVCVSGAQVVAVTTPPPVGEGSASSTPSGAFSKGGLVKLQLTRSVVFGIVTGLSIPVPAQDGSAELQLAELELIGEVRGRKGEASVFRRGISHYPELGDPVFHVSQRDLADVYAPASTSTVQIGHNHHDPAQPVRLAADDLLGKHFAVLGTTGCGKSSAVALILHALLEAYPNAHMLVLDPHNEYAQSFGDRAECLGPSSLHLPYWLLNGACCGMAGQAGRSATGAQDQVAPRVTRASL